MWKRVQRFAAIVAIAAAGQMFVAPSAAVAAPMLQDDGPGYCWDTYVREAVGIFDDWMNCHRDTKWYDVLGILACDIEYEARAVGAALWWTKCVGMPGR